MRVYFAPCGIGLGHVGRTVPIARKLLEHSAQITFSTYQEGIRYVENEKLPVLKAPPIGFRVRPDGSIDFKQTAINPGPFLAPMTFLEQVNAEIRFIQGFQPDVIVSDSRISTLVAARLLDLPRICILNQFQVIIPRKKHLLHLARLADFITLTLIGKIWSSGNAILIPDLPQPYTISIGNLNIPNSYKKKIRLIGPILEVLPSNLPSQDKLRKKLNLSTDKPVIFVPISGSTKEKAFLTGILRRILLDFPEEYEVVMSLGYPNTNDEPVHHGSVSIYKWIPNRYEYLKACDMIIARAGHGTITQAMCFGKPMILIPTPGHTEQINNAKKAQDLGIARILQQEGLNREKLLRTVQQITDNKTAERLKMIQEEVLKYDGLANAVKTINEVAGA